MNTVQITRGDICSTRFGSVLADSNPDSSHILYSTVLISREKGFVQRKLDVGKNDGNNPTTVKALALRLKTRFMHTRRLTTVS